MKMMSAVREIGAGGANAPRLLKIQRFGTPETIEPTIRETLSQGLDQGTVSAEDLRQVQVRSSGVGARVDTRV